MSWLSSHHRLEFVEQRLVPRTAQGANRAKVTLSKHAGDAKITTPAKRSGNTLVVALLPEQPKPPSP